MKGVLNRNLLKMFLHFQRGPADTQNIDPEFTREMVPNSVSQTPDLNASFSSSNAFHGFSFVATEDSFLWGA